ncbi:hypothetical protein HNR07_006498 [Nocardiopsis metallicus]|uniref:Uncharacterized protein n=1 Tax=Nocardiopsis metallicus TaxID=179819 RepID=A0A840WQT6_9ACTN|nr:hypothetical protein [Nocardiopsis metallicus]
MRAVPRGGGQGAQGLVADRVPPADGGVHREVGGAQVAVRDADHAHTGDPSGEADPARARRMDRLAGAGRQVHAQVAR